MSPIRRAAVILVAAMAAGLTGSELGQPLGYAIGNAVDREVAEIKATFIWCIIFTPVVAAAAGAYAAAEWIGASRRIFGGLMLAVGVLAGSVIVASYEPIKTSGTPIIDYELRLPEGMQVDGIGSIDFTIWNEKNGQGCYISSIKSGKQQVIAGSITLRPDNYDPMMSIAFHDGSRWASGAGWALPYKPDAGIELHYRSWEKIELISDVRDLPRSEGEFQIRYRLRYFM